MPSQEKLKYLERPGYEFLPLEIGESFVTEGKPSYQLALDKENVGIWLQTRKKRIR